MKDACDVLVIGAGPAGAGAALALARAGRRVVLCERGTLPRHRLCGEFLSPEAVGDLARLELDPRTVGAVTISRAEITSRGRNVETPLDPPALGISRSVLDAWLARAAAAAGAEVRLETDVRRLDGSLASGFVATLERGATLQARAVLGAFGKRWSAVPERPSPDPPRWVALKAQSAAARGPARVELHAFAGGYLGTAPIGDGRTNVCAVVDAAALPRDREPGALGALRALAASIPSFTLPLEDVDPASVQAESGARFGKVTPARSDVLLAGDAAALPHPLGGDGMAMALRGGLLAARHLNEFLSGRTRASEVVARYGRDWRHEFMPRLRWSRWLHRALVRPEVAGPMLAVLASWPAGMRFAVERTRGTALSEEALAWHRPE